MADDSDKRLDAAGERYRLARDEWKAARDDVADAIRAERRRNPAVKVAELAQRSGLERQAVYEVLGQKVRGGGRSRPRQSPPHELTSETYAGDP